MEVSMMQKDFALKAAAILKQDETVIGLTVGGSWLSDELDDFSDLDLILVTKEKISTDKLKMLNYAQQLGDFLSGFTGEHVGEPKLLVCLYDNPLLHVDIKFLTIDEFAQRVENPIILLDTNDQLKLVIENTKAVFPYPNYQWLEDRFWIWIHYTLGKIARGELFEAIDAIGYIRANVIGQLFHIQNNDLPRGMRKVEAKLKADQIHYLKETIPHYNKKSSLLSLNKTIEIYKQLRTDLYDSSIQLQIKTEKVVMDYYKDISTSIGS
jgi:predicted nucleotidyltransferase